VAEAVEVGTVEVGTVLGMVMGTVLVPGMGTVLEPGTVMVTVMVMGTGMVET
jgi:hypothetical protein